jgi:hypothetical protein
MFKAGFSKAWANLAIWLDSCLPSFPSRKKQRHGSYIMRETYVARSDGKTCLQITLKVHRKGEVIPTGK